MLKQCSIQKVVSIRGIGIHSGQIVDLVLRPANVNSGIVFHRVDINPTIDIPACANYVCNTKLATVLQYGDVRVSTVEHLMSALCGLGIDNLHVDINAEELPIMDGSSISFVNLLLAAGIVEQNKPKKFIKIIKPIEVFDECEKYRKYAKLEPCSEFVINFSIDYNHPAIMDTASNMEINISKETYIKDISMARTFGFIEDVNYLRSKGLALGASLKNVIVLDHNKVVNDEGLRYKDEFLRHKILDAIGDLYLLGHPLLARYTASKSGHSLNNKLVRSLLKTKDACEYITFC
ncbi:UDP-3-O-acyl-N-acetylglucosamine deacetylase [Candidatus Kinetoplastidibacterium crithidiae]|uniref:UDP-3-O-acyl-N-acetylglucosamine deacetylase n=1 Tax=Candidatus Kinetoplastidibacterium crithidiae TCC036E TaxID=1208918 RepID=M1LXB9_9PROT|nr:UDP-3-O-acyl-N-acetylglucosamine deacetylase [Candidatus Kinetoplastibacterium crithidii]AFZ82490.1 UDP-3-O-[3-hydroxymyristoyl] N-acetylglucosamine deacetylase [Candidatus Kinetoplastibacterium crithidii (ex Angomonas deanei ATCC 30255)]AGF47849.1 UDP-3-O-[3-hydroxymyristoyl] N-acetylglucosamine deacetylase [Candidatus Kinetoplastibacterium crithidii TCC036E]